MADPKSKFFRDKYSARAQGCAFCGHLGHYIHSCPAAEEYVNTGHVKIINRCLYLPTGQPILNDERGLGLKAGVNVWIAANQQYSSTPRVPTVQCDPPPHNTTSFSFEVIPDPAVPTGAYITEADVDSDTGGRDNYPIELYNMFEVFATKKTDMAPLKTSMISAPSLTPAAPAPISVPSVPNSCTLQYRYQASVENQFLTRSCQHTFLPPALPFTKSSWSAFVPFVRN